MDIQRFTERFDRLMNEGDFSEAERHLDYWLKEAEANGDEPGRFTVLNEMTGFYRMRQEKTKAYEAVDKLMTCVSKKPQDNSIGKATACLNCATVYNSFGEPEKAIKLYKRAEEVYKAELNGNDMRLAGLYNNLALALMAADRLSEAGEYFDNALSVLNENGNVYNELAITYLNMADLEEKSKGPEAGEPVILELLDKAVESLEEAYKGDFNAFKQTAEKCIPVFKHYGYFMAANTLKERIEEM